MKERSTFRFSISTYIIILLGMALTLQSCHEKQVNPNEDLSLDYYSVLDSSTYALSQDDLRHDIKRMVGNDSDTLLADFYTRRFYTKQKTLVWIDRKGVDDRADTLIAWIKGVKEMGFNPEKFRLSQIEQDLARVRALNFGEGKNSANRTFARLEYNLTKAYFRFSAGQYFGYSNPISTLNHLDKRDNDNPSSSYYTLYGYKSQRPGTRFYHWALDKVHNDSIGEFLRQISPNNPLYNRFLSLLNSDSASFYGRKLLMVNLERSRWRMGDYPHLHNKYVMVNIPSFRLRAVDGKDAIVMRTGCGSIKTKTPLLCGDIMRMDINPQWIMPKSIVKKSIIPRLGNRSYFASRHYFIRNRATGETIDPGRASASMLESGEWLAIQEGGEGNALGRIIFRFDNDFSIYLHDTSSRDVFSRADRDVSHGCIRVERPFDLAVFLLGKGHDDTVSKIRYSMNADVSPLGKKNSELTDREREVADTLKRNMLIGCVKVKPAVPLFIIYFTIFPDADGQLRTFNDVYGYDDVIYHCLENYQ